MLGPLSDYLTPGFDLPHSTVHSSDRTSHAYLRSLRIPEGGALGFLPSGFASMDGIPQLPPPPLLLVPPVVLAHRRSRSFGHATVSDPPPRMNPDTEYPWLYAPSPASSLSSSIESLPPQESLHALLKPGANICWDLSSSTMNAHLRISVDEEVPISDAEFSQPATSPGLRELTIVVSGQVNVDIRSTPFTPIPTLRRLDRRREIVPPITLRDVLDTLHRVLHGPISHIDWARLSTSTQRAVDRAYRRRCRSTAVVDPEEGERQAAQGVKKVDLLLDQFMFRGLVPLEGSNSQAIMRLVTGSA
jgi:hypothetical protein